MSTMGRGARAQTAAAATSASTRGVRSTCKNCRKVKGKTAEKVKGKTAEKVKGTKGCRGNAGKVGVEHGNSAESNVGSWRARGGEEQPYLSRSPSSPTGARGDRALSRAVAARPLDRTRVMRMLCITKKMLCIKIRCCVLDVVH